MSIFSEGLTITRENGEQVILTGAEIGKISSAIDAAMGRGSIEYYIDAIASDIEWSEDEDEKTELQIKLDMAERMQENDKFCEEIWKDYWENASYDTGDIEFDSVDYLVRREIEREGL